MSETRPLSGKQQKKLDYLSRRSRAITGVQLGVLEYENGSSLRLSKRITRDGTQLFGLQLFLPDQDLPTSWFELEPRMAQRFHRMLGAWLQEVE